MLRTIVIVAVANAAMAQVPFLGTCPNLETMQGFDLEKVSIEATIETLVTYKAIEIPLSKSKSKSR